MPFCAAPPTRSVAREVSHPLSTPFRPTRNSVYVQSENEVKRSQLDLIPGVVVRHLSKEGKRMPTPACRGPEASFDSFAGHLIRPSGEPSGPTRCRVS